MNPINIKWLNSSSHALLQAAVIGIVMYGVSHPAELKTMLPEGVAKLWPLIAAAVQAMAGVAAMNRHPDTGAVLTPVIAPGSAAAAPAPNPEPNPAPTKEA